MSSTLVISLFVVSMITLIKSQPYYVAYIDYPTCGSVTDADCLAALGVPGYSSHNYNVLNLAFYVSSQDTFYDASGVWANPSSYFTQSFRDSITGISSSSDWDFRPAIKSKYAAAGVKLLLSVGGASDNPIESGLDATALATKIANFVWTYSYDGVDIDFENTEYFDSNDGTGEEWLITLTRTLYNILGSSYIITHAPMAPYLGAPNYGYGAYLKVHQEVGSMISWYNVQFYNQGSTSYDTYTTLFITANGWATNTAVQQIISGSNGLGVSIPANKIVIGKYVRSTPGLDGYSGWVSASNLNTYFNQYGWTNGFMLWQFPSDRDQGFAFSNTIIGSSGDDSGSSSGTIQIMQNVGSNEWWLAIEFPNNDNSGISKLELMDSNHGSWISGTYEDWGYGAYSFSDNVQFSGSMHFRVTSTSGNTATTWNVYSGVSAGSTAYIDLPGSSFLFTEEDEDEGEDDGSQFPIAAVVAVALLSVSCVIIGGFFIGYCVIKRRKQGSAVSFEDNGKEDTGSTIVEGKDTQTKPYDMSPIVIS